MSNGFISLLLTIPAVVAVHCIVTATDRSDLANADFPAFGLKLLKIRLCALWRHIAAIEECMNIDFLDAIIFRQLEQRIQVILMTVYTTRRNQTHKMQGTMVLFD